MIKLKRRISRDALEIGIGLVMQALKRCSVISEYEAWWTSGIDKSKASEDIDNAISYLNYHIIQKEVK